MATLKDIAAAYNVSKSTARRWVLACFPDLKADGGRFDLDANQTQAVAHYAASRGAVRAVHDEAPATCGETVCTGSDEAVLNRFESVVARLEAENGALSKRCESLEAELERTHEELQRVHAALEREQNTSRGFWNRLGQRLLGSGGR